MNWKTNKSEYNSWVHMRQRCNNVKDVSYKNYGGRGITVYGPWLNSFSSFIKDMGEKPTLAHSLDRIDNDGNYEPGNCRWATPIEQANNKRQYRHEYILNGKKSSRGELLAFYNISLNTFKGRISCGWNHQKAATTPIMKIGRPKKLNA